MKQSVSTARNFFFSPCFLQQGCASLGDFSQLLLFLKKDNFLFFFYLLFLVPYNKL